MCWTQRGSSSKWLAWFISLPHPYCRPESDRERGLCSDHHPHCHPWPHLIAQNGYITFTRPKCHSLITTLVSFLSPWDTLIWLISASSYFIKQNLHCIDMLINTNDPNLEVLSFWSWKLSWVNNQTTRSCLRSLIKLQSINHRMVDWLQEMPHWI